MTKLQKILISIILIEIILLIPLWFLKQRYYFYDKGGMVFTVRCDNFFGGCKLIVNK